MKSLKPVRTITSLSLLCLTLFGCAEKSPVEGTWRLVERELPDGSTQHPPEIIGLYTFTKDRINFNLYRTGPLGKSTSISYIARYTLTDDLYREESLYHMVNDEIAGNPIYYDVPGPSGSSPVFTTGERIEIQLPLYDGPKLAFEGDTMTAIKDGVFIDHWKKIETE